MITKLRKAREKKGLSQRVLAQKADLAQSHLSAAERGQIVLWPKARKAISEVLGVSESELFTEMSINKSQK